VEHAGNAWPAGWVPGLGYVTPSEALNGTPLTQSGNCTLFLPYAQRLIDAKREAGSIAPDEMTRQQRFARKFVEQVPAAQLPAEMVDEDDALKRKVQDDPRSQAHLLSTLDADERDVCIEDVDKLMISDWIRYLRVLGHSTSTIRKYYSFIHQVFSEAVDDEVILAVGRQ
jgi:Phage integrase SAM-like domain